MHQDLPSIGGYALLEVISGSMEPTIKIGDLIVIDKNSQDYAQGDIVTFTDVNGSFVTHRIKKVQKEKMITQGDANNTADEAMPLSSIVGKYVFKLSGLGKIISALKSPLVSIMILAIGILICFLVSTDKNGDLIPDEDTKEFKKYLKKKAKEERQQKNKMQEFWAKLKTKLGLNKNKPKRVRRKVKRKKRPNKGAKKKKKKNKKK